MRDKKREYTAEEIHALTKKMEHLLHGENPLLVGIVLADIVAMYFAGHRPGLREPSVDMWVKTMQQLLDIYGRPPGWGDPN